MATPGDAAAAAAAGPRVGRTPLRLAPGRLTEWTVFVLSIGAALAFWELISRTGVISEKDLPSMTTSFHELWRLMQAGAFWTAFLQTVRGWALGLTVATVLAVPLGILLGSFRSSSCARFRRPRSSRCSS